MHKRYLFCMLSVIYLLAFSIQSHLLLNWDVSWLLEAARRLLAGGSYTKDFFEINPPMILYLSTPAVLFSQYTGFSIITTFRLYVFIIATLSLTLCYQLAERKEIVTIALSAIYLILPTYEFGQREQLMLMLVMPYLLLTATKRCISFYLRALIGFIAGIGFVLKPQYLIVLCLVELYLFFFKPHDKETFLYQVNPVLRIISKRPELAAMLFVFVSYFLSVIMFHRDYVELVIPIISHFYYDGMRSTIKDIFTFPPFIFSLFLVAFYGISPKEKNDHLSVILLISFIGASIAYLIAKAAWFYRLFPAYSLALLLAMTTFDRHVKRPHFHLRDFIFFALFVTSMLIWMASLRIHPSVLLLFYQPLFFAFFACIFFYVLWSHSSRPLYQIILAIVLMILLSSAFAKLIQFDYYYQYQLPATIILLFLLFALSALKLAKRPLLMVSHVVVGVALFALPVYVAHQQLLVAHYFEQNKRDMIAFMRSHTQHTSVYFLSANSYAFPCVQYANTHFAGRAASLGWLPGLQVKKRLALSQDAQQQLSADEAYLVNMVIDDIHAYHPEYIFVDETADKPYFNHIPFSYLAYFTKFPAFQREWRAYTFYETLRLQNNRQYNVYRRQAVKNG